MNSPFTLCCSSATSCASSACTSDSSSLRMRSANSRGSIVEGKEPPLAPTFSRPLPIHEEPQGRVPGSHERTRCCWPAACPLLRPNGRTRANLPLSLVGPVQTTQASRTCLQFVALHCQPLVCGEATLTGTRSAGEAFGGSTVLYNHTEYVDSKVG